MSQRRARAPTSPEILASSLVAPFLAHGEGPNIEAELADYAATVSPYYDAVTQDAPGIASNVADYREKWPVRKHQLLKIELARMNAQGGLEATFQPHYQVSNGRPSRAGTNIQEIQLHQINGK